MAEKTYNFQIGDRVQITDIHRIDSNPDLHNGSTGTVVHIDDRYNQRNNVAVEWDDRIRSGHDCRGHCRNGHGWWVPHNSIELEFQPLDIAPASTDELFDFLGV